MDLLDVSARVEGLRPGLESPYKMFEMIGSDEFLLFSTDYPHWDFDSAHHVFPSSFPKDLRQKILADNARGFYNF